MGLAVMLASKSELLNLTSTAAHPHDSRLKSSWYPIGGNDLLNKIPSSSHSYQLCRFHAILSARIQHIATRTMASVVRTIDTVCNVHQSRDAQPLPDCLVRAARLRQLQNEAPAQLDARSCACCAHVTVSANGFHSINPTVSSA